MYFRSVDGHPNELADLRREKDLLGRPLDLLMVACPRCGKAYYFDQDDVSVVRATSAGDARIAHVDPEKARPEILKQGEEDARTALGKQCPEHVDEFGV